MSADYTPTTEQVRSDIRQQVLLELPEFDRWLAAHDAEVAEGLRAEVARLRERMDATPPHVSGGMSASYWYEQTIKARAGRSAERAKARAADLHASAAEAEIERLQEVNRVAEAKIAAVEALADELSADAAEMLIRSNSKPRTPTLRVVQLIRAALSGEAGAR